jgi:hypothetical protein
MRGAHRGVPRCAESRWRLDDPLDADLSEAYHLYSYCLTRRTHGRMHARAHRRTPYVCSARVRRPPRRRLAAIAVGKHECHSDSPPPSARRVASFQHRSNAVRPSASLATAELTARPACAATAAPTERLGLRERRAER